MMKNANDLISDALLQTGIIPQESDQIPSYLISQGLTLLNDIITEWGGTTTQIPYNNLPINFQLLSNKSSYSFGLDPSFDVNTQPIIDIISFSYFMDYPNDTINVPVTRITEFQYSNIGYRKNKWFPCEYLLRLYPDHSEVLVQALPSQTFNAVIIGKQRLQAIDLYQNLADQFPDNFILCLKYRLMLDLADANGLELSPNFINKYTKSMDRLMASNKIDLTLNNTETLSKSNRIGNYYYGISGL